MPAEAAAPLVVREYQPGDEKAILDLFARSFHVPRSIEHWRWKYQEDPFGREHVTLVESDQMLVGHYAGYVVPFALSEGDGLTHQIGDTMTVPSIRHVGRGPTSVLGRAAAHFYSHFCDGQVLFNYGFNVANIQRFSIRFLRSDLVEPVGFHRRDLTIEPLDRLARWSRWMRGYQVEVVTAASAELDAFFGRVRSEYQFLIRRDAAYIRWRYLDCPDISYRVVAIRRWRRLVGWVVIRVIGDRLLIGDALFDRSQPDAFPLLLRQMITHLPVRSVEAWFSQRPSWWAEIVAEAGLRSEAEPQSLSLMCVPFTLENATARMRESLYYTWGDSDLF